MDKILKFTKNFTKKDYLNVDIMNSAFDDIDFISASVDFRVQLNEFNSGAGLSIELYTVDKITLEYKGYFESSDEWTDINDVYESKELMNLNMNLNIGDDHIMGIRLDELAIDVIKKDYTLRFNEK